MYVVIRIRGSVKLRDTHDATLKMLRLTRCNHAVILPEGKEFGKMIKKVEPYVTYGEIEATSLENMLEKRGRTINNKRIDDEFLKRHSFKSLKSMAETLISGKTKLQNLGMKPVFRLTAPKKGFERKGIKKSYSVGGAAGYRASDINKLLKRMI